MSKKAKVLRLLKLVKEVTKDCNVVKMHYSLFDASPGFCHLLKTNRANSGKLDFREIHFISKWISENMPQDYKHGNTNAIFGWEPYDWKSRLLWLESKIEEFETPPLSLFQRILSFLNNLVK